MNIVEKLCHRIAFLKEGRIIKVDTQDNYRKFLSKTIKYSIEISKRESELIKEFQALDFVFDITRENEAIFFHIEDKSFLPSIFNILKDYQVEGFNEVQPSLEELFLKFA